jgi:hypothetical protein
MGRRIGHVVASNQLVLGIRIHVVLVAEKTDVVFLRPACVTVRHADQLGDCSLAGAGEARPLIPCLRKHVDDPEAWGWKFVVADDLVEQANTKVGGLRSF